MHTNEFNKKNLIIYFVTTYLAFWAFLGVIGFALFVLKASPEVFRVLKSLSAWMPTIVLLLMFNKLIPGTSRKEFLKSQLLTPIGFKRAFMILGIMVGVFLTSNILAVVFGDHAQFFKMLTLPAMFITLLTTLSSGATGEELGWRGYAYNEMRKKYSFTGTAIALGLVWTFWHTPLWFIEGYSGLDQVYFIFSFTVATVSHSIIIAFFYERTKSIWAAILTHGLFNYLQSFFDLDLSSAIFWYLPYLSVAVILIIIERRKENNI